MQSVCCSLFDMLQKFYFSFVQVRVLKKFLYVNLKTSIQYTEMSYFMFYKL